MSRKVICWILRIISLSSLVGLVFVLIKMSPYENQNSAIKVVPNIISFFIIFFTFCFSVFSLFFFWIKKSTINRRERKVRNKTMQVVLGVSIRQGFLLALGTTILLGLQTFRVFTWWDGLLALGAVFMVELYFLSK